MEVISCHASTRCYIVNFGCVKDYSLHRSKLQTVRANGLLSVVFESASVRSGYFGADSSRVNRIGRCRPSMKILCKGYDNVNSSSVLGETYGEESGTTGIGQSVPKVSIPSLPGDENSDNLVSPIKSSFWELKPKLNVHYETSGLQNVGSPSVLFLPGFGVGSFHYEKQLKDLGQDYRTWALDFLGQGMSLPSADPTLRSEDGRQFVFNGESNTWGFGDESEIWAEELVYSVDLWRDQVRHFVEEVTRKFYVQYSFVNNCGFWGRVNF